MAKTFYEWLERKAHEQPERYDEFFRWLLRAAGNKIGKGLYHTPGAMGAAMHWMKNPNAADQLGKGSGGYYGGYMGGAMPAPMMLPSAMRTEPPKNALPTK